MSPTGSTRGVLGEVYSPDGVAGRFNNINGGQVLAANVGQSDSEINIFSVDSRYGLNLKSASGSQLFHIDSTNGGSLVGPFCVQSQPGSNCLFSLDSTHDVNMVNGLHTGGSVQIDGNLTVSGSKNAVQTLPDGRRVALSAVESPESWFEDFGTAQLQRGLATVELDPTFAATVNTELEYHVFLTPQANCRGLYVAQTTPAGFEVRELGRGKSSVAFDYRIVARRRGFEKERLKEVEPMRASR